MNTLDRLHLMLTHVANALGPALVADVAFVGGCVVGLLLTDPYTRQQVRATDDVDLIVDVVSYADYVQLQSKLRERGFRESMEDDIACRWRLGELVVDVMPIDEKILGFSNRWYELALQTAEWHSLDDRCRIRIVKPAYFFATKIEAFRDRGRGDFLGSRDVEDIVNLVDGRESLFEEIVVEGAELRNYIAIAIREFICSPDFEYAIQSATNLNAEREKLVFERLDILAGL